MTVTTSKDDLHHALRAARDTLLRKLDGLSEYDARRPLTATGTNLLGLVKHTASVALIYFGETFDRPSDEHMPWLDDGAAPDADMWAAAHESREDVVAFHHRAWTHADATLAALPLDALGRVPHWPRETNVVTLHSVVVRMIGEMNRHAGHADIVRELVDGAVGWEPDNLNLADGDAERRRRHHDELERAARDASPLHHSE